VTIHASDPFATPEHARSPLRRLRGRMPATVTLWTAYGSDGRPAGLTVSSTVVADGEPGVILGLIDEESDLYSALTATGRAAVAVLRDGDDQLADRFAGILPAPGGLFADEAWERTEYGPVRSGLPSWAGCRLASTELVGYARLVRATVETVHLDDPAGAPLIRHRGRYVRLSP
jgi:3-hydroxy-9,10-secoandrosta-1,3,5(10)-triene-9,17-dione monooxygenase reductase component